MTLYARYDDSRYKYGDSVRLYGVGAADTILRWAIEIDWNGDGVYDGTNENEYATSLYIKRGRRDYIKISAGGVADGFEGVDIGTCTVVMDNSSRRFDPYNTASELYPYILPGRYIRVRAFYASGEYNVFHGKIKNIIPIDNGAIQQVRIEAEDGLRNLQLADVFVSIQQNIDKDDAIGLVLDDAEYPTIYGRSIEDASDVLTYWWSNRKALTEIQELADSELGTFFVAGDGKATFYSRHHTAAPTLTLTSADLLKNIEIPQPWEVVRNYIKIYANPRVARSDAVLWTLADFPLVGVGRTIDIWASYTYNNNPVPALSVAVSSSDYTMNTQEDGLGADLSSDFSVTITNFGETGKIRVTNNGATAGYITLLQVTGAAIDAPNPSLLIAEDATSQGIYGRAVFELDNKWIQSTSLADNFASWINSFLPTPQRFIKIGFEARPDIQFTPELFDVINLTITKLGIAQNFKVGGVEHRWLKENGQAVRTYWNLEPFQDVSGYWTFDATTGNVIMGVGTIFGF